MALRLFAALSVPDEISDRLVSAQRGVLGASWRPKTNFHVTLRFFGEISETLAEELDQELAEVRSAPFDVSLASAGWFGGAKPSALWVGLEDSAPLMLLAQRCERAARRVGLPADARKFTPHITLAYCHGTQPDDAMRFVQRLSAFRSPPFLIDQFALYSSWLGKGPSRYVEEASYPLRP